MRGALLQGAHLSPWTTAFRSRQGLGTLQARTCPSGRRLFRSRQGTGTLDCGRTSLYLFSVVPKKHKTFHLQFVLYPHYH